MDATYCRECGAPVEWARDTKGHRVLLEPGEVDVLAPGALAASEGPRGVEVADVANLADQMADRFNTTPEKVMSYVTDNFVGRTPHKASCAGRAKGRRTRANS